MAGFAPLDAEAFPEPCNWLAAPAPAIRAC